MPKSSSPTLTAATSRRSPNHSKSYASGIDLEKLATDQSSDTESTKHANLASRCVPTKSPDTMLKSFASAIDAEAIADKDSNAAQQFCLRWNNYQRNLTRVFDQLLQNESFVDVTLACDGSSIKAHKMVLSACSPYFQNLFFDNPCQHPIVIMRDIKWTELKAIVEFMYKGEIKVSQAQIGPLLRVAEMLQIRGLTDVNGEQEMTTAAAAAATAATTPKPTSPNPSDNCAPPQKRPRAASRGPSDWDANTLDLTTSASATVEKSRRNKRNSSSTENRSPKQPATPDTHFPVNTNATVTSTSIRQNSSPPSTVSASATNSTPLSLFPQATIDAMAMSTLGIPHPEEMEIKPGIAEMIREEERAKLLENAHTWPVIPPANNAIADSYQYQLQSMWQKCWSTNQNLIHHLRFRERGPLKSWRPETMAEAIFSVLKDGLSLSQAARKYDIPYPTFVLYANRVHNMLGPSIDGGPDLRPKGRGRPQRILLGIWPDDHIKGVIKAVVFRDAKEFKDDAGLHLAAASAIASYGRHSPLYPFPDAAAAMGFPASNGVGTSNASNETLSSEAAAAVAAVVGMRQQQMRNHTDELANFALPTQLHSSKGGLADAIPLPKLGSPATSSQLGNSTDIGFPMPRLASPAIPSMHGLSGLSSLHLMQNFGGNSDLLVSSSGSSRRGTSTSSTHTDTKKSTTSPKSNANGGDHAKRSEKNNNNRCTSNGERSDSIQDLSASSPLDKHSRFSGDDFDLSDLDIHALPFKPSLHDFLTASPNASHPKFADDLSDFEHATDDSATERASNSIESFQEVRDKIKIEPVTENK